MTDPQNITVAPPKKNPWIAFFLSLLFPGLGHLYVGSRAAAAVYAVMGAGVWFSYFSSHSFLSRAAVLFIFPFVFVPTCRDAVDAARGKKKAITGEESRWYVIWMLCCIGPFAIPLLWQNKKFSVTVKVIWTIIVVAIVGTFFLALNALGHGYDEIIKAIQPS